MGTHADIRGIIPPYLLSKLADDGAEQYPVAAAAARKTLAVGRPPFRHRGQIDLSVDDTGSLVIELTDAPNRTIFDAQNARSLPGLIVREEGEEPTADETVNAAYDGLGATYDLLLAAFERNSLDGAGAALHATVHYGEDYDNAFWDGERMVFGDGDGEVFSGFANSVSVIGHELAHGVIQHTANLVYRNQSGALNESISDVFGALTEQYLAEQTADAASWLIGSEIFTDAVQGVALRNMLEPGTAYHDDVLGTDPQPGHMRDFVTMTEDNGGVHVNSGIPNRAFALLALDLGGFAWERAGVIWYHALTGTLSATATFTEFADATVSAAQAEYGNASEEVRAVERAWRAVGVYDEPERRDPAAE
ncbi:M4 family metallopeptidase [Microbacterium mitrae]|uniref:M4 family metallopeptidase n=1 Tax=Microbacterium mitrae TaxID=664640 RepID=UPI00164F5B53|nr:M4 family metallopeptidase [Microbacterium mitrae]